jgi:protein-disulfide isomerase
MAPETRAPRVSIPVTVVLALAAFMGGYLLGAHGRPASPPAPAPASLSDQERALGPGNPRADRFRVLVSADDPGRGPEDALITIVEFADFQEIYSGRAAPTVRRLLEAYPREVRVVFKQNPLSFHEQAFLAAEAALAAGEQGKFWAYHDVLFAGGGLDRAALEDHARELGLDLPRFRDALDRHRFKARVEADQAQALRLGVRTAPVFFINGRLLRGAQPYETFRATVDSELRVARKLIADRQLAPAAVYAELMKDARVDATATRELLDPAQVYKVPLGSSPQQGSATAKLTLVLFTEFDCGVCAEALPIVNALRQRYGADLRVVLKTFPMPGHAFSVAAAEAALAAGEQGKLWEYHDLLVRSPQHLDRATLERHATSLGLDLGRWRAALDGGALRVAVNADAELGLRLGLRGTPTMFINGRPIAGVQPVAAYVRVADAEKARAETLLAAGVAPADLYEALIRDGSDGEGLDRARARPAVRPVAPDPAALYRVPVAADDVVLGPATAKVTVVEFGDFDCPPCAARAQALRALAEAQPEDLRVVFKQAPTDAHPRGLLAAEAALAAAAQGKFWPMHDKLCADPARLDRATLTAYAGQIGLDVARFTAELDGGAGRPRVARDLAFAAQLGVTATPAVFINGRYLGPTATVDEIRARVAAEAKAADDLLKAGTPRAGLYDAITAGGLTASVAPVAATPVPPASAPAPTPGR